MTREKELIGWYAAEVFLQGEIRRLIAQMLRNELPALIGPNVFGRTSTTILRMVEGHRLSFSEEKAAEFIEEYLRGES